jgi:hypothetical protein
VTANNIDWLRVDCERVEAADEDAAREAALLVRADGLGLRDVARMAGLDLVAERLYVADLPRDLQPIAESAAPGELVGPVSTGNGRFALLVVRDKVVPTIDDAEIRERAEQAALDAALARAVAEHVRWLDGHG